MATKKAFIVDSPSETTKFEFSDSFKKSFDALIKVYADALAELNKVSTGKALKSEYGVCSCTYKLRYVTPNDVSTYVSNLIKGLENGLFKDRIGDVELFTVASVKRFIEDNKCPAFEESSVVKRDHGYVNPKEQTLHDLACICENDIGEVAVYSRGEMLKRLELMKDDLKKLNDMHFTANMKKIVSAMPDVLKKSGTMVVGNSSYRLTFGTFLEEFLLFICTLNTIAVLQLVGYAKPTVDYTIKKKDDKSEDVVTECCLVNTTNYMVRNKLPFNCNMRDVVLQDVTPNFKDVHDAMHFIMKDPRSPISVLVSKYADKDITPFDSAFIAKMFIGLQHDHDFAEYLHKDGDSVQGGTPREVDNFETNVDWLDTIAFGNNYLDGNYRRDAVGNNKVHPILNSLDMLYKVYGGCDLKTNKDLANNLVRVAGAMRSIVHNYGDGEPVENYDLTKDILVVLGEIFTRNMLRLYYNNTLVYTYDDDMPDAAAPGFICMEAFVMEADANTNGNTQQPATQQGAANNGKSGVTFTNAQGQQVAAKSGNISNAITKLLDWIKNQLAKFSGNFAKRYKSYVDYVTKNKATNDAIAKVITDKTFIPNITNIPAYKLDAKRHAAGLDKAGVEKILTETNQNIDGATIAYKMIGIPDEIIKEITTAQSNAGSTTDKNAKGKIGVDIIENYFLSGKAKVDMLNGQMSPDLWNEICQDLEGCIEYVDKVNKTIVDKSAAAGEAIKAQQAKPDKSNEETTRCGVVEKALETAGNLNRSVLYAYGTKFFNSRYSLYRDIVTGFQQQQNNNTTNTPQPAEAKEGETPAAPTAGTNNGGGQ